MSELHRMYLSLGSNIGAEVNLPNAMQMLREAVEIKAVSSVWESESVGFAGPNFLNACALILSPLPPVGFKEGIIRPIEAKLGRVRSSERSAPRTIDIDIVLNDATPLNTDFWEYAFVIVPLAEMLPDFKHPASGERLSDFAAKLKGQVWMRRREDVVIFPTDARSAMVPRRG